MQQPPQQPMRQQNGNKQQPIQQPIQQPNNESYQNAHHPVNLNPGYVNNFIKNNDERPIPNITKNETVSQILDRLHSRDTNNATETQDSATNDRLVSDVSLNTSEKKRKKKKIMQIL